MLEVLSSFMVMKNIVFLFVFSVIAIFLYGWAKAVTSLEKSIKEYENKRQIEERK